MSNLPACRPRQSSGGWCGRVGGAGGEIGEDRPVRGDRFLLADPADAVVGQVARQLVALFGRLVRFDRRRAAVERREELVRLAADEPVEIVEPHVGRPAVERAGGGGLVVGDVVVLAEPGRGVAVLVQDLGDGGGAVGNEPAVPGIAAGNFLDDAGADAVVVAPGQQRGARRRAEGGGVEGAVAQPVLRQPLQRRALDRPAEGAQPAEPDVIEQHQQDVRRAGRRLLGRREVGGRVGIGQPDLGIPEGVVRFRVDRLLVVHGPRCVHIVTHGSSLLRSICLADARRDSRCG